MGELITGTSSFECQDGLDCPNELMESLISPILHETSLERMKAMPQAVCSTSSSKILLDASLNACRPNEMRPADPAQTNLWRPVVISQVSDLPDVGIPVHTSA